LKYCIIIFLLLFNLNIYADNFSLYSKKVRYSLLEIKFKSIIRQATDQSCGSAALATLLKYFLGEDVSEKDVLEFIGDKKVSGIRLIEKNSQFKNEITSFFKLLSIPLTQSIGNTELIHLKELNLDTNIEMQLSLAIFDEIDIKASDLVKVLTHYGYQVYKNEHKSTDGMIAFTDLHHSNLNTEGKQERLLSALGHGSVITRIKPKFSKKGVEHFIVLRTSCGNRIYIADPSLGNIIMTKIDFFDEWVSDFYLTVTRKQKNKNAIDYLDINCSEQKIGKFITNFK